MENLYIIGYMASGKTTFGRALAEKTGRAFIDLDEEIEKTTGETIAALIGRLGIDAFRELEKNVLHSLHHRRKAIIACGGGTPCHYDNMDYMNSRGATLWLKATPERIALRVREAGPTRPLLAALSDEELPDYIERNLKEREPFYSKAKLSFSGEHLENEKEIAESIENFLQSNHL